MKTKYGNLPDSMLIAYVDSLVGKFYKILPMKEKRTPTLNKYLESLLREMYSNKDLIEILKNDHNFIELISIAESLINQRDIEKCKSDVFKAIGIIKRITGSLVGDKNV